MLESITDILVYPSEFLVRGRLANSYGNSGLRKIVPFKVIFTPSALREFVSDGLTKFVQFCLQLSRWAPSSYLCRDYIGNILPLKYQGILHACLDRALLSIGKFSRWLRAICTILLSRGSASDRTKAAGYVEQAVRVLQDHATDDDHEVCEMCYSTNPRADNLVICCRTIPWTKDIGS